MQTDAADYPSNEQAREKLIASAHALIAQLETPNEFVSRTTWAEPARNAALGFAMDGGLLELLASQAEGKSLRTAELANAIGGDEELVGRMMRHLAAMHIVAEHGPDQFAATPLLRRLAEPRFAGGLKFGYELFTYVFAKLPIVARERGYRDFTDANKTVFHDAMGTDLTAYIWLIQNNPELGKAFNLYMTGYRFGIPKWYDPGFYPVVERLDHPDLDDTVPLLVDVAGGLGADISEFITLRGASLRGRIILQDLPPIIDAATASGSLDKRIECMPYDFFTRQPIKGARAYHLHSILHNWPDKECFAILKNLRAAMRPGFSKLLIFEHVIPEQSARWPATAEDLIMAVMFAARERKEGQWKDLLRPHGLVITGIWSAPGGEESLIEAEVG